MRRLPEPEGAEFNMYILDYAGGPYVAYEMYIWDKEYAVRVTRSLIARKIEPRMITKNEYELIKYHHQQKLLKKFWRRLGAA